MSPSKVLNRLSQRVSERSAFVFPILWVVGCPASPEREDQRAAGRPAALTQLALCLRLASNLRPKADNAPSTLNDSTRQ